ncbi:MAG: YgeY family selenium metabolism-linked hydrolase [Anaerolinea sp.]|nr:YgeY family selenium metabolism-linked hydrolase [Anaerolinea sp.]
MLTDARRAQIIEMCQSLVQIQSLAGQEGAVIARAQRWMHELGYRDVAVDPYGNLTGTLVGTEGTGTLLFDSHVDTVAAQESEAWRFPPFSGQVAEGRIWGRGTSDMKGALAASLAGAAYAAQDGKLRGRVIISASVGEEVIEGLALREVIKTHRPDLVIICESTDLKLNIAGRGRAEVTLVTLGKSAHASTPHLGVNALKHMARLILELDKLDPPFDPLLGAGILEPTEVIPTPFPSVSVLPWRCRARYDRRLLVGETQNDVLTPIQDVIDRLKTQDSTFNAHAAIDTDQFTCYTGQVLTGLKFQSAWQFSPSEPFAARMLEALQKAGQSAGIGHYSFCTNGSYSAVQAGIPTLGYGPGTEEVAHTTDEYLELSQLWGAAQGYYAMSSMGVQ